MTDKPIDLDAWPEEGEQVVIVYGYEYDRAEETTVARLTPRDVVLANGVRFRRASRHHPRALRHKPRSLKTRDYRFLLAADDPEAVKALQRQAKREAELELKKQAQVQARVSGAVGATIHDTFRGEPITATWTRGVDPETF